MLKNSPPTKKDARTKVFNIPPSTKEGERTEVCNISPPTKEGDRTKVSNISPPRKESARKDQGLYYISSDKGRCSVLGL